MNSRIRKKVKYHCMYLCFDIVSHGLTPKRERRLRVLLKQWSKINDVPGDYGYTGDPLKHIFYCSDRMNSGRARAILRLLDAPKVAEVSNG